MSDRGHLKLTDLGLCYKLDEGLPPTDALTTHAAASDATPAAAAPAAPAAAAAGASDSGGSPSLTPAAVPAEGTGHERSLPATAHVTHDRRLAFSTGASRAAAGAVAEAGSSALTTITRSQRGWATS